MNGSLDRARTVVEQAELEQPVGQIRASLGLILRATLPGARRGDWVRVHRRTGVPLDAEVVAFEGDEVRLMPLGSPRGVGPGDRVEPLSPSLTIPDSEALLGRVLDGLGRPLDDGPALRGRPRSVELEPVVASRANLQRVLPTGIRCIDALCTLGEGQRIGLFAPPGVGKTTLLTQLARHTESDVVVAALVGERGRELHDWLEHTAACRERSVLVCATSNQPALVRMKSLYVATTIAEAFRDRGQRVLLLVDSLTRFVRAAREVGLSAGEPPARRGFPPSAFAELAPLIERAGPGVTGSISAVYTVLVEGNDLDEPVADETKGLLDGQIVLCRERAQRGYFPAIDVAKSLSRAMDALVPAGHLAAARELRRLLAHYEHKRELLELGAYVKGSDPLLEGALRRLPAIDALLRQERSAHAAFADTLAALLQLFPHS